MQTNVATDIEIVLGMLVVVLLLGMLSKRVPVALPVLQVVAGLAIGLIWGFVPGLPFIRFDPEIVFLVFLPPLLVSAAYEMPLAYVRRTWLPIASLAVGLVLVSSIAIAFVSTATAGLPLAAGFVLGAIVAPPDPVAAKSIGSRLGFPLRMMTVLEGEGLINDATALTLYQISLAAVVTRVFAIGIALRDFVVIVLVGVGIGLLFGWLTRAVLRRASDPTLEALVTLLLPYVSYLVADRLKASGVLAAVTSGFLLRHRIHRLSAAPTRLRARAVWDTLVFTINGVVFLLIGFEVGTISAEGLPAGFWPAAAVIVATAIGTRFLWMFIVPPIVYALSPRWRARGAATTVRQRVILSWAGMRGVISLAAALAIPYTTVSGAPFPGRPMIVLLTFAVILTTLVLQGLTLPPLLRRLGVAVPGSREREEELARRRMNEAAIEHLERRRGEAPEVVLEELIAAYRKAREGVEDESLEARQSLLAEARRAERRTVERMRDSGEISDETATRLERELDRREVQPR